MPPVQWPLPAQGAPHTGRLFAAGGFSTPDRKARFVATPFRPVAAKTDRRNPFLLNTGRVRDQWHTMTRTGLVPRLMIHQEEPFLELHPHDAMKLCLEDGDLVRVQTEHASTILRAKPTAAQRIGEVFAPMHWTDDFVAQGPAGRLVSATCDPLSGQPELKATAARLAPVPTLWRGVLLNGAKRLCADGFYYARIPGAHQQVYELRGYEPLPAQAQMAAWADEMLGHPSGAERVDLMDPNRATFRFASLFDGRLRACLLLTRDRRWPLPERDAIEPLLGRTFDKSASDLLFRIEEAAMAAPIRDRKVCACFSVGRIAIEHAIVSKRLTTCSQVGAALRVGTNCGSCIPEIEEVLRDVHAKL
jgi:assimilatory nitrate reductase catalytic subunit